MKNDLVRKVYDILIAVKADLEKRISKIDNTIKAYESIKSKKNNK